MSLQIPRSITFEVPRNAVKQAFPSADLEGSSKALVTFSTGTNEATGKELLAVEDQTKIIRTIQKLETVLQYMATNEFILNIACVNNRFLLLDPANMNSLELLANIQRLAPLNFNSINVVPKNLDPKNIKAIEGVLNLSLDKLSTMDLAAIVRIPKGSNIDRITESSSEALDASKGTTLNNALQSASRKQDVTTLAIVRNFEKVSIPLSTIPSFPFRDFNNQMNSYGGLIKATSVVENNDSIEILSGENDQVSIIRSGDSTVNSSYPVGSIHNAFGSLQLNISSKNYKIKRDENNPAMPTIEIVRLIKGLNIFPNSIIQGVNLGTNNDIPRSITLEMPVRKRIRYLRARDKICKVQVKH